MKSSIVSAIIVIVLMSCPIAAIGATIRVPADYPDIQTGIDVTAPGDTVLVAPGTYVERIEYRGWVLDVHRIRLVAKNNYIFTSDE